MKTSGRTIVLGASAGGIPALRILVEQLNDDMDAAVFVVLHLSPRSNAAIISATLQKHTSLKCVVPCSGDMIKNGCLYIAPQNHHMLIKDDKIILHQGARENKYRPSIDVLFRSAAVSDGPAVIGVILTGLLDDGTAGMSAISRCGGTCIIQDRSEAQFPDMPQSVINQIEIDYEVSLADMGSLLLDIIKKPVPKAVPVPREILIEAQIAENMSSSIGDLQEIAEHSNFTCAECGGGLWKIHDDPVKRYRCHTGHVFTERFLFEDQGLRIEKSVWVSIRMLEERRNLLMLMASSATKEKRAELASENQRRADEMSLHIDRLKVLLSSMATDAEQPRPTG
jgi:two-component system, chemotaxis family, protein-glutamate methylesterase/glutaminase